MQFLDLLFISALASTSQAANLIRAGNFEAGTWGKWQGTSQPGATFTVVSPGFNGSKHAGAHNIATRDGQVGLFYTKLGNLTVGQQYRWSLDYKLNNPDCFTAFQTQGGILMGLGSSLNAVENGTWEHHEATYIPSFAEDILTLITQCNVPLSAPVPIGPTAEFDNMVFETVGDKVYTLSDPPTGPNLIQEPNFESGTLAAYKKKHFNTVKSTVVSPGYNGANFSLQINSTGGTGDDGVTYDYQKVKATLNGVYKLGFAMKLVTKINLACSVEAYVQQGNFNVLAVGAPYQMPVIFPVPGQENTTTGVYHVYESFVSAFDENLIVAFQTLCEGGTASFELGNLEFVPLS